MSGGCSKCEASAGHGVVLYQSGYIFPRIGQADNNCLNSALKRLALIVLGHQFHYIRIRNIYRINKYMVYKYTYTNKYIYIYMYI